MKTLLSKTVQGVLTHFMFYYGVEHLPLTEVTLISNISPIVVAILSYFILKEGLRMREVFALIISFAGILCLIIGRDGSGNGQKSV